MGSPAEEVDPATKVEDQGEDDAKKNSNEKKHDSGAADLERVTDYAEEKEIVSTSTLFTDAIANIRSRQDAAIAEEMAREKELAKVSIRKEDVDSIVEELEVSREVAERTLREHHGNVEDAMIALIAA